MSLEKKTDRPKGAGRWILPLIALLVVGALIAMLCFAPPTGGEDPQTSDPTQNSGALVDDAIVSTPTNGTSATNPITNTTPSNGSTGNETQTQPTEPDEATQSTSVTVPPEQQLICADIGLYNGAFVEDGSDEPVENVAALLITNGSAQYLDLAKLTYEIDGQEAVFMVTGLPAGASAWVLENSRMTASAESQIRHKETVTSFRENAVSTLEGVDLAFNGTMLKATNATDKTIKALTVYYKVLHDDGNYLGGITYMVTFGDLEPGQSAEKIAGHFRLDKAQIVRIGYVEE